MTENRYGFISARDIFECAEFVGEEDVKNKRMEYYSERNQKDGWTLDTVLDDLMSETSSERRKL